MTSPNTDKTSHCWFIYVSLLRHVFVYEKEPCLKTFRHSSGCCRNIVKCGQIYLQNVNAVSILKTVNYKLFKSKPLSQYHKHIAKLTHNIRLKHIIYNGI